MCRLRGVIFFNSSSTIGSNFKLIGKANLKVGKNLGIGDSSRVESFSEYNGKLYSPEVTIGNNCSFGNFLHIGAINKIAIGNGVLGGSGILILDHNHGETDKVTLQSSIRPALRSLVSTNVITIEDNVWLGDNVKVLSGAHIGYGSVIQANAIVSKFVPPYSICTDRNNILDNS
jgi:acetyltransferase-like isoleucine patch superfamily enzyme